MHTCIVHTLLSSFLAVIDVRSLVLSAAPPGSWLAARLFLRLNIIWGYVVYEKAWHSFWWTFWFWSVSSQVLANVKVPLHHYITLHCSLASSHWLISWHIACIVSKIKAQRQQHVSTHTALLDTIPPPLTGAREWTTSVVCVDQLHEAVYQHRQPSCIVH